jgi:hypothetical protein
VPSEATDPALRKIEKNAIVEVTSSLYQHYSFIIIWMKATPVSYSSTELLGLILIHLQNHGLTKTANVLMQEAVLFFALNRDLISMS